MIDMEGVEKKKDESSDGEFEPDKEFIDPNDIIINPNHLD